VLYVRFAERDRHAARERQLQLTLHEAELRALEAQINPHFLFNSLNSIRALVVVDPPRAQDMLTRLANVLRNTLRHDRQHTVTLAVEMQGVDDYLALEAARLDERLRVECSIDAAAADCAVPPLLVHTLVENAIKHGIAVAPAGGVLVVRARVDGSMLQLDVENTGRLSRGESSGSRLGLTNVRERLRLLYDGRASVTLGERQGMVTATVRIPCGA
jgi:LytS/YehU family sensor histidine kinase